MLNKDRIWPWICITHVSQLTSSKYLAEQKRMLLTQESPIPGIDPIEMLSPKDMDENFKAGPFTTAPKQNNQHGHQWEKSK